MTGYTVPEHSRPLTPRESRVLHTLGDQVLNDGWTSRADLLALLIDAQAYGIDLGPVDVITVLDALLDLGLVQHKKQYGWRVVTDRPDPVPVVSPPPSMTRRAIKRREEQAERRKAVKKSLRDQPWTGSPKDVPMFNRRKTETKPVTISTVAIEAGRVRLQEKFYGPGHVARAALEGDPVLTERLDAAMSDGLEIDLTDVPKFRRGAYVEEALVAWETARENGPCQFCGTATPRRGREVVRYQPGVEPDTEHQWAVWAGQTVCRWCRDVLGEHGDEGLRGLVFRAAASIRSAAVSDRYYLQQWVPWWSELTPEAQAQHRKAGAPWGHIDQGAARVLASDLLMRSGEVGFSGFATTVGQVEHVSIPGLQARAWTPEEMPKHAGPVLATISTPASETQERQNRAWAERRAREAKRAAEQAEADRKAMVERDARIAAMDEDERTRYEQSVAAYVVTENTRAAG